jgi:type I restriction enzyme, S subunit
MSSKTPATDAKQEATPALMPKLRFPEFQGEEFRDVRLGDVTEESGSRNGHKHTAASVMGVTKADGIVPMEARLIAADIARYKLVQNEWFAYNPMRLNIGSIAQWKGKREILVSPDYVVFKCISEDESGINPAYFDQFKRTNAWDDFVTEGGDGSVRVRIYYKDIARLRLALPSPTEQKKIAKCLTSVDELIAAHARKLHALKTHKKGLMQQLFPREGETEPRLRFPEFQNAGEWETMALKDIAEIRSGSTPLRSNQEFFAEGSIPWVKTTDLNNSLIFETEEKVTPKARARVNPEGSVLVAMYGGFNQIGRTGCLSVPAATNQAISVLVLDRAVALPIYVLAWLNAKVGNWKRIASSSRKDPNITGSDVAKFPITLPKTQEQQRIADCLTALENLITAQAQKLTALKTHKKGLMQQLFPSPEIDEA